MDKSYIDRVCSLLDTKLGSLCVGKAWLHRCVSSGLPQMGACEERIDRSPESDLCPLWRTAPHLCKYANEMAMEGYRSGRFPDGSVIVFDVLETLEKAGVTSEGPRRLIDVMTRDGQRYGDTGGWGFEEFKGDSQTDRVLTAEGKTACYTCHTTMHDR